MNSEKNQYIRFTYEDALEKGRIDSLLHKELNKKEQLIRDVCENLYNWNWLDENSNPETVVSIVMTGLEIKDSDDQRKLRRFELEISMPEDPNTYRLNLFEHTGLTEESPRTSLSVDLVATACVDRRWLQTGKKDN